MATSFHRLATMSLLQIAETIARTMGVDEWEIERRKAFLEFTDRDVELLRDLHTRLTAKPAEFVDAFYAHLLAFEETRQLLSDPSTVERLKHRQAAYFDSLTAGRYGADYVHHRIHVGAAHHRIGLGPKWYLGAYNKYLAGLMTEAWGLASNDPQKAIDTVTALVKIVFFDIGLTLDTYHHIDRWTIADLQTHAQQIVANIPSGVVVLSADLRVLFASRTFLEIADVSPERAVGMPLEAFFPGVSWWDRVARVLGVGESQSRLDVELVGKQGTRHLQMTLAVILRSTQEATEQRPDRARLLLVVDDVTERKRVEDSLRESQRSLSTLISNLSGMVYRCANDPNWTIEYASEGALALTGYPADAFLQQRVMYGSLIHPDDQQPVWNKVQENIQAKRPFELVYRIRTAAGDERWVWEQGQGVFSVQGDLLALEGFVTDITERRLAEEARRESEDRYRNLIENAHDMIQSVGPDGRFLFVNRAWLATMGYSAEEVSSLTLFQVIAPQSLSHCQQVFERLLSGAPVELVQAELVAKDGRTVLVEGNVTARYSDGQLVATHAIFRNVTERREWEARLDHMTHHDLLTNLPNRAVFMDRISQALVRIRTRRTARPLAVLLLDLDRFKLVNETLGHESGDRLLSTVAQRLTDCLRNGDTVARLGGDEFAILLPEIAKASDMVIVVEKIFAALRASFVVDGHEIFMTTSIGISIAPDDGDEAGVLLRNADAAMYRAKDQGRNTYQLYSPAMNVSTLERLSLESNLRHALERDEFVVYYQPQVRLGTGRIIGVEALVRWQHPEWGLVSPARFIPLAEETGLIVPIGERVLRAACTQNRGWQDQGIPSLPVSVNLSARQFQQPDLKAMIARVLRETGLDPRWLELELTESLLMEDADRTIATLGELRAMGIRVAMDDFGIGYSSLSYLKRFPIDTIKIDQSFVRHVTTDADDAAIATAIIAMAHSLKLTVVAEGVETDEQSAFLAQQQCDAIQGYLVSPPRPAEELTTLLRTNDSSRRAA
ncbi:MAG: EAL domain-containing protein [Nitrospirota bacterium]